MRKRVIIYLLPFNENNAVRLFGSLTQKGNQNPMTISNQKKNNFYWITVIIILFLLPLVVPNLYQMHLINIICINIIMAIGLNIVKGFAGQVTVAHIGLYAMGAYSSAILAINYDLSFGSPCQEQFL